MWQANGIVKKIDQSKTPVIAAEQQPGVLDKLEDPAQEFDVSKLNAQIEQECVYPDGFGAARGVKRHHQVGRGFW